MFSVISHHLDLTRPRETYMYFISQLEDTLILSRGTSISSLKKVIQNMSSEGSDKGSSDKGSDKGSDEGSDKGSDKEAAILTNERVV